MTLRLFGNYVPYSSLASFLSTSSLELTPPHLSAVRTLASLMSGLHPEGHLQGIPRLQHHTGLLDPAQPETGEKGRQHRTRDLPD